jgi:hypothetical protein
LRFKLGAKSRAVEGEKFVFVANHLGEWVVATTKPLATAILAPERRSTIAGIAVLISEATEIPVLDLVDSNTPGGMKEDDVGTKAVHVWLDVDLPALWESAIKDLNHSELARGQRRAKLRKRPSFG